MKFDKSLIIENRHLCNAGHDLSVFMFRGCTGKAFPTSELRRNKILDRKEQAGAEQNREIEAFEIFPEFFKEAESFG